MPPGGGDVGGGGPRGQGGRWRRQALRRIRRPAASPSRPRGGGETAGGTGAERERETASERENAREKMTG